MLDGMQARWIVALLASLALNVALWVRSRGPVEASRPASPSDCRSRSVSRSESRSSSSSRSEPGAIAPREHERDDADEHEHEREHEHEQRQEHAPATARSAGAEAELAPEEALRDIARDHLREHWRAKQAEIVAGLQRDALRPEWFDEDVAKTMARHRERSGLVGAEDARLEAGYRRVWAEHGPLVRELVTSEDWRELLAEIRDVWRDEDRLAVRELGSARAAAFRASELRGRTAIAAILATFADMPWDDAIAL